MGNKRKWWQISTERKKEKRIIKRESQRQEIVRYVNKINENNEGVREHEKRDEETMAQICNKQLQVIWRNSQSQRNCSISNSRENYDNVIRQLIVQYEQRSAKLKQEKSESKLKDNCKKVKVDTTVKQSMI